jgi:AbrB family looped-hinge helix DNA binding protein
MLEILATVTEKGQVTIPADVRRKLGIGTREKVAFVVTDDGRVEVRRPTFPTVRSMIGIAGKLPKPMDWNEMRQIAHEDAGLAKMEAREADAATGR